MTDKTSSAISSVRRELLLGSVIVASLLLGIGGWASQASISSAVIGAGEVVVEGNQKQVQHLEGGIVAEIRVREGQLVDAGALLVRLDGTADRAKLQETDARLTELIARRARLQAEASDATDMALPAALQARKADPDVAAIVRGQRDMFAARRQSRDAQIVVYRRKIEQLAAVADSLRARVSAKEQQAAPSVQGPSPAPRRWSRRDIRPRRGSGPCAGSWRSVGPISAASMQRSAAPTSRRPRRSC